MPCRNNERLTSQAHHPFSTQRSLAMLPNRTGGNNNVPSRSLSINVAPPASRHRALGCSTSGRLRYASLAGATKTRAPAHHHQHAVPLGAAPSRPPPSFPVRQLGAASAKKGWAISRRHITRYEYTGTPTHVLIESIVLRRASVDEAPLGGLRKGARHKKRSHALAAVAVTARATGARPSGHMVRRPWCQQGAPARCAPPMCTSMRPSMRAHRPQMHPKHSGHSNIRRT